MDDKKKKKPRKKIIKESIILSLEKEKESFSSYEVESELKNVPIIPVRDIVMFPGTIISLFIGRKRSINAINKAIKSNRSLAFCTQKDPEKENIKTEDLPKVGIFGEILQCIVLPDETIKLLIDCSKRIEIDQYYFNDLITADVKLVRDVIKDQAKATVFMRTIIYTYEQYISLNKKLFASDVMKNITAIDNPSIVTDVAASYMTISMQKKAEICYLFNLEDRMKKVIEFLNSETDVLKAEKEINDKVRGQMDKNHREYYLKEQMEVIRKELGDHDDSAEKYQAMLDKNENLSQVAKDKIKEEIKKLRNTPSMSSEAGIIKSYLDLVFALPWKVFKDKDVSMQSAKKILESTHYGMDKAKERILEYIAVQMNTKKVSGNVICLYGPPGIGKTTLVKSIAEAMGRKYIKVSLGGLHDSAELFGHRRTYIGALPGRIIQAMKKAGESDPVILLDEIDKMTSDYRGDPSAAMLEILDQEQNSIFNDHYLEIEYDISNVVFIATANSLDFSSPLRDRMEILKIPSYLEQEKLEIAKKYLVPKQFEHCGLKKDEIEIKDDAIEYVIQKYTREAGVRELERCIAKISRKTVVKKLNDVSDSSLSLIANEDEIVEKKKKSLKKVSIITKKDIKSFLGIEKFAHSEIEDRDLVGVVNGLAYTESGGDVLLIEAIKTNGKGDIKFTGKLGDVMKESIQAAHSYIKANAKKFDIDEKNLKKFDIHIHAPEGATPKDGPSAGITISTAIVSLLSNKFVSHKIAMTGEITLRGKVLPIGGLREKLTAAVREKITDVIIPNKNIKDLEDIPSAIKDKLKIHPCETFDEVYKKVFLTKNNGGLFE